jgi:siderophore synthetase component
MTSQYVYSPLDVEDEQSKYFQKLATFICMKQLIQAALREDWVNSIPHGDYEWFIPFWRVKALLVLRGSKSITLGRLSDFSQVLLLNHDEHTLRPVEDINELLQLLALEAGASLVQVNWQQLQQELNNSIANNALCLAHRQNWDHQLATQAHQQKADNFWLWIRSGAVAKDVALFFEQWGAVGHPYHPCTKTKLGLTSEEVLQYSPEFEGKAKVQLLALARTHVHVQHGVDTDFDLLPWLTNIYPQWLSQWQQELNALGLDSKDYSPIPAHPWQVENEIKPRFAALIRTNKLVLLPSCTIDMGATMSFRTMAPLDNNLLPHIKLPVAIQATSAIRTVSPASVSIGAQVSHILKQICQHEHSLSQALTPLPELLGLHVEHQSVADDDRRFLSALLRTNPNSVLKEGETAVVVASLFVDSPLSKRPLFVDILSAAGAQSTTDIKAYFTDYVHCLLLGHLDLYLVYGIALEAHQQNTLVVFDSHSKVTRMLARDFGGVCVHAPTLAARGYEISAYPNAVTVTDDQDDVRKKFIYAVLQSHIGEWVKYLHQECALNETQLWAIVASEIKQRLMALKPRLCPEYWQQESQALLQAPWQVKALVRMRVNDDAHHNLYAAMDNPLNHDSE